MQSKPPGHRAGALHGPTQRVSYGLNLNSVGAATSEVVDVSLSLARVFVGRWVDAAGVQSDAKRVANSHLHRSPNPEDVFISASPATTPIAHGTAGA